MWSCVSEYAGWESWCGWRLRCWYWTGKGGESGDMVMHVGICRLWELVWVVALRVSQGSWCWWWLKWCSVSGPCAVSWRIKDSGDTNQAADGACKRQPPGPTFTPTQPRLLPCCNGAQNRGSDGERRGTTAAFSRLMGRVGVGEAEKRERGKGRAPACFQ